MRKEVSWQYNDYYKTRIGKKALKEMIELLEEVGLVVEDIDPLDKRYRRIYSLQRGGEKTVFPSIMLDSISTMNPTEAFQTQAKHHRKINLEDSE